MKPNYKDDHVKDVKIIHRWEQIDTKSIYLVPIEVSEYIRKLEAALDVEHATKKGKRVHTDYVYTSKWFAWFPVKTQEGWVWLMKVWRTIDERPEVYCGLLPERSYKLIE